MTEAKLPTIIKRKTYMRAVYEDESLREGKTRAVKTSPLMVEIRPHQYVNHAAAVENDLINSSDILLPPE